MELSDSVLFGIVESIWSSVLGMQVERSSPSEAVAGEGIGTACVHITGPWSGAVTIACPAPLGRRIAAVTFGMEEADVGEAEVTDALGELANIAGGNIKALLPPGCQISLPTVVDGTTYTLTIANSRVVAVLHVRTEDHPLVLRVMERDQS
ncbi:MAG: chemotaxis protein CheX [Deltaproteobacteria bacterium]